METGALVAAEDQLAGSGQRQGCLLAAQRGQSHVGGLLAAHEHGSEGGAHAGASVQLGNLRPESTSSAIRFIAGALLSSNAGVRVHA